MSKTVFIIDIDTSIADNTHRASLLRRECLICLSEIRDPSHRAQCGSCGSNDHKISQASWDSFLDPEALLKDVPVEKAQDAIYRMRELDIEFHFITGRNESLREVTETWLKEYFGWDSKREELVMRELNSRQSASVYKECALKALINDRDLQDCKFIFMEDDPFVFRMYQQYGIVIKCPEGWEHWLPTPNGGFEPTFNV